MSDVEKITSDVEKIISDIIFASCNIVKNKRLWQKLTLLASF